MKNAVLLAAFMLASLMCAKAEFTDLVSVYLYTNASAGGHDGLHWAWSEDGARWNDPAPWQKLISCDYGAWGAQKRMIDPAVCRTPDGVWHALWSVNETDSVVAHASSPDLIHWKPQQYISTGGRCVRPTLAPVAGTPGAYGIVWHDGHARPMKVTTTDFRHYSAPVACAEAEWSDPRQTVPGVMKSATGCVVRVSRAELDALIANAEREQGEYALSCENEATDAERFGGLKTVEARLNINRQAAYDISPMLFGVFFEDINHAADGGLYAELVQNRDFEYAHGEQPGNPDWGPAYAWKTTGQLTMRIDSVNPIHPNNPHYATIGGQGTLRNQGFDGIAVRAGQMYDLSMWARARGKAVGLRVELIAQNGTHLASASLKARPGEWQKLTATLKVKVNCMDAWLLIGPSGNGEVDLDMVSLFPQDTFKGRANGMRRDLAEYIAALHPRFVRFPGGCVAHGDGLGNIYRWKNTIGPLEARVPQRNLWGYHQTAGLGFHEYFQFCEDIGAEPVPVVAAGVPCQNSSHGGAGQQGGIDMAHMTQYVQDVLDLVEYANGDAATTAWGRKRAENGHPAPFGLKYIGVGNEDLISDVFEERFAMIHDALRAKYPEITVIGTAGPFHSGSDYDEGWRFAREQGVKMVDEHYYEQPGWFINNQHFYDNYDRRGPKVYLGEYASKNNGLYNALAEALYLTGVERNGDVVAMTSYAPLLARIGATNWNPDLLYFSSWDAYPTPNYTVQRLFGENAGTRYLPCNLEVASDDKGVWARIGASVVEDPAGDLIVKVVNILPVSVHLSGLPHGVVKFSRFESKLSVENEEFNFNAGGETILPPHSMTIFRYLK